MRIAIIGAGISSITIAQNLKKDATVSIFEKSKSVGGRMAFRRSTPYEFDHGAQFFTAKGTIFKNFIKPLIKENIIKRWDARFAEFIDNKILRTISWNAEYPHYVGTPGMNSIAEYLSTELSIKLNTKVNKVVHNANNWELFDDDSNNLGKFDWVISTAPAIQSAEILPVYFKYHKDLLDRKMVGCFSLMLGFKKPISLLWDVALIRNADISWISINSSKPDRGNSFSMLINSTNAWAEDHLSDDSQSVISYLQKETTRIIGHDTGNADHVSLKAWHYANISKQTKSDLLIDYDNKLASCGDWITQGRIENAFEAGFLMAQEINKIIK
ncbi:FAD-dependent oxidoreductase [Methylophilaceae bacterium]|nr:FAD-dependent oxidoreductase [Methylophilaceae bacterium]